MRRHPVKLSTLTACIALAGCQEEIYLCQPAGIDVGDTVRVTIIEEWTPESRYTGDLQDFGAGRGRPTPPFECQYAGDALAGSVLEIRVTATELSNEHPNKRPPGKRCHLLRGQTDGLVMPVLGDAREDLVQPSGILRSNHEVTFPEGCAGWWLSTILVAEAQDPFATPIVGEAPTAIMYRSTESATDSCSISDTCYYVVALERL